VLGRIVTVLIVAMWLAAMGWMVRREVLPPLRAERAVARSPNYAQLEALAEKSAQVQMGIHLANGKRIGSTRGSLKKVDGDLVIENRTYVNIDLGLPTGAPGLGELNGLKLYVHFKAHVVEGRLAGFDLVARPGRRAEALAVVTGIAAGDRLNLTIKQGDHIRKESVPFDARQVLSSDLLPGFTAGRVRAGERWTVRTIDPATYGVRATEAEVVGKETIEIGGKPREAWLIRIPYQSYEVKIWATPEGEVLQQKIPGFVLKREDPTPEEEADAAHD
jgi:hypothetical protein